MLTVGGWFDAEDLFGAPETYKIAKRTSPTRQRQLVMGPWFHGGWARGDGDHLGDVWFDGKTERLLPRADRVAVLRAYLKGKGDPKLPEAWVFETGTNAWQQLRCLAAEEGQPESLYLHAGGQLASTAPNADGRGVRRIRQRPGEARAVYSDAPSIGMRREHMTDDQRFAGRRTDVLVYQTRR